MKNFGRAETKKPGKNGFIPFLSYPTTPWFYKVGSRREQSSSLGILMGSWSVLRENREFQGTGNVESSSQRGNSSWEWPYPERSPSHPIFSLTGEIPGNFRSPQSCFGWKKETKNLGKTGSEKPGKMPLKKGKFQGIG